MKFRYRGRRFFYSCKVLRYGQPPPAAINFSLKLRAFTINVCCSGSAESFCLLIPNFFICWPIALGSSPFRATPQTFLFSRQISSEFHQYLFLQLVRTVHTGTCRLMISYPIDFQTLHATSTSVVPWILSRRWHFSKEVQRLFQFVLENRES